MRNFSPGTGHWLWTHFLVACRWPVVARVPMAVLGWVRWALMPGRRQQVTQSYEKLAQVAKAAGRSGRLTEESPKVLTRKFFRNRVMLGVAPSLAAAASPSFNKAMFRDSGMQALEDSLTAGKGLVYVGTHYGALGITPALLAQRGHRVIILRDKRFDQYKDTRHGRHFFLGATPLFLDHDDPGSSARTLMVCARALKDGAVVAYTCDATHGSRSYTGQLFGIPVHLRTALIELAIRCNCTVSGAFTYVNNSRPHTHILPPKVIGSTQEMEHWCSEYCKIWEEMLLDHPESLAWSGVDRSLIR